MKGVSEACVCLHYYTFYMWLIHVALIGAKNDNIDDHFGHQQGK